MQFFQSVWTADSYDICGSLLHICLKVDFLTLNCAEVHQYVGVRYFKRSGKYFGASVEQRKESKVMKEKLGGVEISEKEKRKKRQTEG